MADNQKTHHKISLLALVKILISTYHNVEIQIKRKSKKIIEFIIDDEEHSGRCLYNLEYQVAYDISFEWWDDIRNIKDLLAYDAYYALEERSDQVIRSINISSENEAKLIREELEAELEEEYQGVSEAIFPEP